MPVVKFFAGLDLEQKSSFLDGHYIAVLSILMFRREHCADFVMMGSVEASTRDL